MHAHWQPPSRPTLGSLSVCGSVLHAREGLASQYRSSNSLGLTLRPSPLHDDPGPALESLGTCTARARLPGECCWARGVGRCWASCRGVMGLVIDLTPWYFFPVSRQYLLWWLRTLEGLAEDAVVCLPYVATREGRGC